MEVTEGLDNLVTQRNALLNQLGDVNQEIESELIRLRLEEGVSVTVIRSHLARACQDPSAVCRPLQPRSAELTASLLSS